MFPLYWYIAASFLRLKHVIKAKMIVFYAEPLVCPVEVSESEVTKVMFYRRLKKKTYFCYPLLEIQAVLFCRVSQRSVLRAFLIVTVIGMQMNNLSINHKVMAPCLIVFSLCARAVPRNLQVSTN